MSELRTNRIVPRDGLPAGASGGVIQVVTVINTVQRSNTSHSITDNTWQFTGTTATITPTRSDSKILITFDQSFFWQTNAGGAQGCGIRIYRGSTPITTNSGYSGHYLDAGNSNNNRVHSYQHGQKLDSPATTSAVTYNLYGYYWTNDWTSLRYQYNDGNDDSPSTITLMEISG
jgi:hypothetical protein